MMSGEKGTREWGIADTSVHPRGTGRKSLEE